MQSVVVFDNCNVLFLDLLKIRFCIRSFIVVGGLEKIRETNFKTHGYWSLCSFTFFPLHTDARVLWNVVILFCVFFFFFTLYIVSFYRGLEHFSGLHRILFIVGLYWYLGALKFPPFFSSWINIRRALRWLLYRLPVFFFLSLFFAFLNPWIF